MTAVYKTRLFLDYELIALICRLIYFLPERSPVEDSQSDKDVHAFEYISR